MQRSALTMLTIACALAGAGYSQTTRPLPPAGDSPKQAAADTAPGMKAGPEVNSSAVGMDQAVITLKGSCTPVGGVDPAKDCVGAVNRADFEKLAHALQPSMPADAKRGFATNYGRLLIYADAARALHLENDPDVQQILQFVNNQVLAESLKRHYAEQYAHPSDEQIQNYYNQNSAKYLEAKLDRIVIPRNSGTADKPKLSEADQNALAEKLRQRWIAGEDAVKLQQAAYEAEGISQTAPPQVSLGSRRAGSLPVSQESVFQLKTGEVSQIYVDPGMMYIYKMESARQIPVSEVKDSIAKTLQQQQLQDKLDEIGKSATVVLNDEYFGPASVPGTPAMAGRPAPTGLAPPANPPK